MMKVKYSIQCSLMFIMMVVQSNAQSNKLKKAGKEYNKFAYQNAIETYESAGEKPLQAKRELGESYYISGNTVKAAECWKSVATSSEAKPEDLYRYSFMLRANGNYEESEKWMKKFSETKPGDSRAKAYNKNAGSFSLIQKDEGRFSINNLNINSPEEDFGTAYYMNKVVFASSREGGKAVKRSWNGNGLSFLNIYSGEVGKDGQIKSVKTLSRKVNKKYHDGPASFSKDGKFMIFTRNNYNQKSSDGTTNLELFSAEMINGRWQKETALPFNNKEYSVGQPSLSADGNTLYFTSDMPGGIGGTDIYKATKQSNGTWGKPQNLGTTINTEGNEMFPFYHSNEILFFASDGHVGLGGLDIFHSKLNGNDFSNPKNIGATANTSRDDFAFVLDDEMKSGYLSSNREGGKGDDDIYSFSLLKPFSFGKIIKGTAKDKEGNIISNAIVTLFDDSGKEIATVTTLDDGAYSFIAEPDKNYKLNGNKKEYFDGSNKADTYGSNDEVIADVILEKNQGGFSLYCLVTDKATEDPLSGVKIKLVNTATKKSEEFTTETMGSFRKALTTNKLNDRIKYSITLEKEGYLTKTVVYSKLLDKPGQYNVHEKLDLTMDKIAVGADLAKLIDIKPIYFDLGKYNIRKDAALELEKIVKVMNENESMVVELGSHTDCRSSKDFNEKLSSNRAKASAAYIKSRISNPNRIYGKGYGESKLVNGCECEGAIKPACSEAEHQKNRRTEFVIVKM